MRKLDGYPNVTIETARAMLDVLDALNHEGPQGPRFPSKDVQAKALRILDRDYVIAPDHRPPGSAGTPLREARVLDVLGEGNEIYQVTMFTEDGEMTVDIMDFRCTCPAQITCSHILVALTRAETEGLRLVV